MSISQTLKPCPFCGSDNLSVNADYKNAWVTCLDCWAFGPKMLSKDAAIEWWNKAGMERVKTRAIMKSKKILIGYVPYCWKNHSDKHLGPWETHFVSDRGACVARVAVFWGGPDQFEIVPVYAHVPGATIKAEREARMKP